MIEYKWLSSEPTEEMVEAAMDVYFFACEDDLMKDIMRTALTAALQVGAAVEQNPGSIVRRYRDGTIEVYPRPKSEQPLSVEKPME